MTVTVSKQHCDVEEAPERKFAEYDEKTSRFIAYTGSIVYENDLALTLRVNSLENAGLHTHPSQYGNK